MSSAQDKLAKLTDEQIAHLACLKQKLDSIDAISSTFPLLNKSLIL